MDHPPSSTTIALWSLDGGGGAPRSSPPGPPQVPQKSRTNRRVWPLRPLAPLVVVVVGAFIALLIGTLGVSNLATQSDANARRRADLLAASTGARLSSMPMSAWLETVQFVARKSGAEVLVIGDNGDVLADATVSGIAQSELTRYARLREGVAQTGLGRTQFAAVPLKRGDIHANLLVFVRRPAAPEAAPELVRALLALTTLLVGAAALVSYAVARDANKDVEFVAYRVSGMAQIPAEPTGEPVPVRSLDEVGLLAVTFNDLVSRFSSAKGVYREDLSRVRAADRDRAAFLAAVSHELRSPLNAILGFADLLIAEVDGPLTADGHEEVEQIRGSGQHLLELINDILELSALESGQLRLTRSNVDIYSIAAEVVREADGLAVGRPLVVRVEGERDVIAYADPKRVRQILTNLVGNAIKFTQRGEVVVHVQNQGRMALFSVRDTGPGIDQKERAIIFEEYKQSRAERRKRRGTGLGLAITRRLVRMHGGHIELRSELGVGSEFIVSLPIKRAVSSEKGRAAASAESPGRLT